MEQICTKKKVSVFTDCCHRRSCPHNKQVSANGMRDEMRYGLLRRDSAEIQTCTPQIEGGPAHNDFVSKFSPA